MDINDDSDRKRFPSEMMKYLNGKIKIAHIKDGLNENCEFKQKPDNISSQMTEFLAQYLIYYGTILHEMFGDNPRIEYTGMNVKGMTNDLLINGHHKVEIKATTSENLFTTVSKNNLKCSVWIWLDFSGY